MNVFKRGNISLLAAKVDVHWFFFSYIDINRGKFNLTPVLAKIVNNGTIITLAELSSWKWGGEVSITSSTIILFKITN